MALKEEIAKGAWGWPAALLRGGLAHFKQFLMKAVAWQAVCQQVALYGCAKRRAAAKPHAGLFPVCYLGAHMFAG